MLSNPARGLSTIFGLWTALGEKMGMSKEDVLNAIAEMTIMEVVG